jgi:hypothetical protein
VNREARVGHHRGDGQACRQVPSVRSGPRHRLHRAPSKQSPVAPRPRASRPQSWFIESLSRSSEATAARISASQTTRRVLQTGMQMKRASDDFRPTLADRFAAVQPASRRPPDDPLQPQARASCASAKCAKRKVEIGRDSRPGSGSGRKCGACCPTGGDRASISQAATKNFVVGVDGARTGASSLQERDGRGPPPHVPPCTGDDP